MGEKKDGTAQHWNTAIDAKRNNEKKQQQNLLRDVIVAVLKRWWLVVIVTLVFGGAMFAYGKTHDSTSYRATVKMYVNTGVSIGSSGVTISAGDVITAQSMVYTYNEIINTNKLMRTVITQLREDYCKWDDAKSDFQKEYLAKYGEECPEEILEEQKELYYQAHERERFYMEAITPAWLRARCVVSPLNETEVFTVTFSDDDINRCMEVVNTIAHVLEDGGIQKIINGADVKIVDESEWQDVIVVKVSYRKWVLAAAALGFLLSAGYAAFSGVILNDAIESDEWITETFGGKYPLLGSVPDTSNNRRSGYGYRNRYNSKRYYRYYYYSTDDRGSSKSRKSK